MKVKAPDWVKRYRARMSERSDTKQDNAGSIPPYGCQCPVCEGVDQPGLTHNSNAPYCTENRDCACGGQFDDHGSCPSCGRPMGCTYPKCHCDPEDGCKA